MEKRVQTDFGNLPYEKLFDFLNLQLKVALNVGFKSCHGQLLITGKGHQGPKGLLRSQAISGKPNAEGAVPPGPEWDHRVFPSLHKHNHLEDFSLIPITL